jgi:glutamine synthetase
VPQWNYDGSSTKQADGHDSEVNIVPCCVLHDPFMENSGYQSYLVLCKTYDKSFEPLENNNRHNAEYVFQNTDVISEKPWFGMEQEYYIFSVNKNVNITKTKEHATLYPFLQESDLNAHDIDEKYTKTNGQGQYYCSTGIGNAFFRDIINEHYLKCLKAGIEIFGHNLEVGACQGEFQIGTCEGIHIGDHLWMARYIMERIAEMRGIVISWEPKPLGDTDWNGSGCHTNFSTEAMRLDGGLEVIKQAMLKLEPLQKLHIDEYGEGNQLRMTGKHETSDYRVFTYGVASRDTSVRIGNETQRLGKGYFEDRRPSSNCDPYLVSSRLVRTICLNEDVVNNSDETT